MENLHIKTSKSFCNVEYTAITDCDDARDDDNLEEPYKFLNSIWTDEKPADSPIEKLDISYKHLKALLTRMHMSLFECLTDDRFDSTMNELTSNAFGSVKDYEITDETIVCIRASTGKPVEVYHQFEFKKPNITFIVCDQDACEQPGITDSAPTITCGYVRVGVKCSNAIYLLS